ncbi:MerR family transcriptional regulator [Streptomyces radiopugnans]|uniref:MerR HTH family regulatory protein n=1 Tax=Streptomyces radiopugnans TaxID=403935 RepID=A0A1H9F5R7_9ACTN|nr:MerR HTH family regulatory protein [Streptomyces radiopugnans]
MSELSRRSGVPVPTIKFYLREGLLRPGRATASNQAEYEEEHLRRLRLVRALITLGGLSVAATREVLEAVGEPLGRYETLGVTHYALRSPVAAVPEGDGTDGSAAEVERLVERMGWTVTEQSPLRGALAAGLRALRGVGADYGAEELVPYAELAAATARLDLDQLAGIEDRIDIAERALVLTVLMEPVLATLRRMAQENEAALRYAGQDGGAGG